MTTTTMIHPFLQRADTNLLTEYETGADSSLPTKGGRAYLAFSHLLHRFIPSYEVFLGAIFCYFIIIPAGFEWLIGETSAVATALPDLENYVNMELLFMIGFGVAFELPLIIFYLSVFHIVSYAAFRSAWRYVYVGLLVGSAVITPDGSPVTLGLMYGALLSLYEISLAIARVVITAREGKEGLFVSRLDLFSDDEDDEE